MDYKEKDTDHTYWMIMNGISNCSIDAAICLETCWTLKEALLNVTRWSDLSCIVEVSKEGVTKLVPRSKE